MAGSTGHFHALSGGEIDVQNRLDRDTALTLPGGEMLVAAIWTQVNIIEVKGGTLRDDLLKR